MNISMIVDVI